MKNQAAFLLFPLAVWLLLFSWRPFAFGFYHDDWNLLVIEPSKIIEQFWTVDPSRPLAVLFRLFGQALVGTSPSGWQVIVILSHLVATASLIALIRAVLLASGDDAHRATFVASVTGAFYLAFPWMLGTAWASGAPFNTATTMFNLALLAWFAPCSLATRCIACAAALAASGLLYEAYWFAVFPFAGLVIILRALPRRDVFWLVCCAGIIQFLLLIFNRLIAYFGIGANKPFNSNWLSLLGDSPRRLRLELIDVFGSGGFTLLTLVGASFIVAVILSRTRHLLAIVATIAAGALLATALYAVAGYGVSLTGLFSRTSIGVSWWLAMGIAMLLRGIPYAPPMARNSATLAAAVLLITLATATFMQSQKWAASWRDQKQILNRLARLEPPPVIPINSFLIVEMPAQETGIGTFSASWDISAALRARAPRLAGSFKLDRPHDFALAVAAPGWWRVRVSNGRVTKMPCDNSTVVVLDEGYARVFVAKLSGEIAEVTRSADIGCSALGRAPSGGVG